MTKKRFIHGDMDGVACQLVLMDAILSEEEEFQIVVNPNDLASELQKFIDTIKETGGTADIIIADLDLKEDALEIILNNISDDRFKFQYFDHHPTSVATLESFPEYSSWLHATNEKAGCKILYEHFHVVEPYFREDVIFKDFICLVDLYDRGKFDVSKAVDLNLLFKILGPKAFISAIRERDRFVPPGKCKFEFLDFERIMIHQRKNEIERIVDRALNGGIHEKKILGRSVAVTVMSKCDTSIICSKILAARPDYDYIINIDLERMTAELRTNKDDVNLTEIAKRYGGGGHVRASGFPIPKYEISNLVDSILGITGDKEKREEWFK